MSKFAVGGSGRSRISITGGGRRQPVSLGLKPTFIWHDICQSLHENERNWTKMGIRVSNARCYSVCSSEPLSPPKDHIRLNWKWFDRQIFYVRKLSLKFLHVITSCTTQPKRRAGFNITQIKRCVNITVLKLITSWEKTKTYL